MINKQEIFRLFVISTGPIVTRAGEIESQLKVNMFFLSLY